MSKSLSPTPDLLAREAVAVLTAIHDARATGSFDAAAVVVKAAVSDSESPELLVAAVASLACALAEDLAGFDPHPVVAARLRSFGLAAAAQTV